MHRLFRGVVLSALIIVFFRVSAGGQVARSCTAPTPQKLGEIEKYVKARSHIEGAAQMTLLESTAANAECFWKLHYTNANPKRDIVLFLSPDSRYLVPALFDLQADPLVDERIYLKDVNDKLRTGHSPSIGVGDAPVTIVEFSDFECPYCKRLTDVLEKDVLASGATNVRLVYKYFPLPIHPWAKEAAYIAECANLQDPHVFWQLHDFFFANQASFTPANLKDKTTAFLASNAVASFDQTRFKGCLDEDLAEGPVQQDIALGEAFRVKATPTFFINGSRFEGARDAQALRALITAAARGDVPVDGALAAAPAAPVQTGRQPARIVGTP